MVAEGAAALVTLGLMALWVRANRVALALFDAADETDAPFRAWVAYQPPMPRREQLIAQGIESQPRIAA
jgi:hypothetical protein